MSEGRHRVESPTRSLRLPRQVTPPAVGAGAGAVVLAVSLVVTLWPDAPPKAGAQDLSGATALRAQAAFMLQQRASRDRSPLPPTAPATPAASATPAVPKPRFVVVGNLWVKTDVNVRSGPSADSDRVGSLKALTRVPVTATSKSGWIQVVLDGRGGWVKSTYLSRSKPKLAPQGVSDAACSISPDIERHLSSNAQSVYRAVCAAFGSKVSSFGGYRAGDNGDHGSGHAVDIMISGDPGLDVARYVQAHAKELGVTYVIYQQKIWMAGDPTSSWKGMEDRGSTTANHFDHVHVSVS